MLFYKGLVTGQLFSRQEEARRGQSRCYTKPQITHEHQSKITCQDGSRVLVFIIHTPDVWGQGGPFLTPPPSHIDPHGRAVDWV
ncbi:unnamed protein product [Boreogadus saida]